MKLPKNNSNSMEWLHSFVIFMLPLPRCLDSKWKTVKHRKQKQKRWDNINFWEMKTTRKEFDNVVSEYVIADKIKC
jgi:hypothetical protein